MSVSMSCGILEVSYDEDSFMPETRRNSTSRDFDHQAMFAQPDTAGVRHWQLGAPSVTVVWVAPPLRLPFPLPCLF